MPECASPSAGWMQPMSSRRSGPAIRGERSMTGRPNGSSSVRWLMAPLSSDLRPPARRRLRCSQDRFGLEARFLADWRRYPSRTMFAYYDRDADIAWFPTGKSNDVVSERVPGGLRDYDRASHQLVAIEVWDASTRLPASILDALPAPAATQGAAA
jgi:uncharacterized protein YuzE